MHSASLRDVRASDIAQCRAVLRDGSRSFYAASLLLPSRVRNAVSAIYAFCRDADDLVDRQPATHATVERLTARLDAIYDGRGLSDPVDRSLSAIVDAYAIPQSVFGALLEGFAWEADRRQYETLDDVIGYSVRVAASVGVAVSCVLGRRRADVLARATDLGIAMQMTNIARDVGEDARAGRLYLPRTWLRDAGIDPEAWLRSPTPQPEIAGAVRRLLEHADTFYRRADAGIAALPAWSRPSIRAARSIYADIGRVIARSGYDSVTQRAFTGVGRKVALATRALVPGALHASTAALAEPPHPRASFLVHAAALPTGAATRTTSHFATI